MKRYLLCLVSLFLIAGIVGAQGIDNIIADYAKEENAEHHVIDRAMLEMGAQQQGASFMKKMEEMEVLSIGKCSEDVKKSFLERISNLRDENGYSTLVKTKEGANTAHILIKKEEDIISELYIFAVDKNDAAIVKIKGRFEESDVKELANRQMK